MIKTTFGRRDDAGLFPVAAAAVPKPSAPPAMPRNCRRFTFPRSQFSPRYPPALAFNTTLSKRPLRYQVAHLILSFFRNSFETKYFSGRKKEKLEFLEREIFFCQRVTKGALACIIIVIGRWRTVLTKGETP
jgi:hypothetical protein